MNFVESAIKCAKDLDSVLTEVSRTYDVQMERIQNEANQNAVERGISVQDALYEISERLKQRDESKDLVNSTIFQQAFFRLKFLAHIYQNSHLQTAVSELEQIYDLLIER